METAAITVRWKVEDLVAKMEAKQAVSVRFAGHIRLTQVIKKDFGCLMLVPRIRFRKMESDVEVSQGKSTRPKITGIWRIWTALEELTKSGTFTREYNSSQGWGWSQFISLSRLSEHCKDDDAFIIECAVYYQDILEDPSITPCQELYKSMKDLFEDTTTDVIFQIRPESSSFQQRTLLAHQKVLSSQMSYFKTLFNSGFSEGKTHDDDDSREWLPAEDEDENLLDDKEATNDSLNEQDTDLANIPQTTAETEASQPFDSSPQLGERVVREIIVTDTGYIIYRALLYWLYTHKLVLTEVASNYLVHLNSQHSHASASPDDANETSNTQGTTSSIKPRRTWLLARAVETRRWNRSEDVIEPASPHALYRLADKLDVPEVKKLTKLAIVNGLTVENVLYELISTFSYHYPEMQEAALTFALEHWEKVKLTSAFQQVITGSCLGRIEGANEIWMKLLMKLTTAGGPSSGADTIPANSSA
ncbi:hypothetical protein JCM3765_000414 [Sporobolomyces pararoseus]